MQDHFLVLGEQSYEEIAQKLREIGDEEAASFYEAKARGASHEEGMFKPRAWLDTNHQYGFIPLFAPGSRRYHDILSANNTTADASMRDCRINIYLQRLHVHEYPTALGQAVSHFVWGTNVHTILFTFEVRNQVAGGAETVAFNQVYEVASGQDAGVAGYPIFTGLSVGRNGISLSCRTVNVGSTGDKKLLDVLNSNELKQGLNLLTTAQPGLVPFVGIARGLAIGLASRSMNVGVQRFSLGLDFETGALGARLTAGSYIVAQVPHPNTLIWSDWCYDSETESVVRKQLAVGEDPYILPHNTVIFRVSPYHG